MNRLLSASLVAGGVALTVGGASALLFGLVKTEDLIVTGFGPFDGFWSPQDYCFLGAVLASLGSGLTTFGLMTRRR